MLTYWTPLEIWLFLLINIDSVLVTVEAAADGTHSRIQQQSKKK